MQHKAENKEMKSSICSLFFLLVLSRGSFSVECIFTLFGFKLLYPNHFFMSRGNHESENMNKMYGFEGEVKAKYPGKGIKPSTRGDVKHA